MTPCRLLSLLWLCLLGLLSLTGGASAQTAWRDLPPEERRQLRQQMREHWAQERGEGSVGQTEDKAREGRRRWQDVPPEERLRLREEMRRQRQEHAQTQTKIQPAGEEGRGVFPAAPDLRSDLPSHRPPRPPLREPIGERQIHPPPRR